MDALLAAAAGRAGAAFRDGTPVLSIAGSLASGFEVVARTPGGRKESVGARVVLGAWGKRSILDRTLERTFFQKYHPYLGVKSHYVNINTGRRVELHGFREGYIGMAAIEGGLTNVCLLATERAFEAAGRRPERLFEQSAAQNPVVAERFSAAERTSGLITISQIAFGPKAPVERDILMIGDTAELISPLAGNGMAMALRAAELAVPLVTAFLATGDAGVLVSSYTRAWRREFRTRLTLGRLIQPLFLRPRLLAVGLFLLRFAPPVGDLLIQGTRDTRAVSTR
jgi:flavin-dependent dehydrogenase